MRLVGTTSPVTWYVITQHFVYTRTQNIVYNHDHHIVDTRNQNIADIQFHSTDNAPALQSGPC